MPSCVQTAFFVCESGAMAERRDDDVCVIDEIGNIFFCSQMVADYIFVTYYPYLISIPYDFKMLSPVSPQDSVSSVILPSLGFNLSNRPNEVENHTS